MQRLDEIAKRLVDIKAERRDLKAQDSALSKEFDEITQEVKEVLTMMGVEATKTAYATLSITKKLVPAPKDWDAFEAFCKERDALFLYQKRISSAAWKEMRDLLKAEFGEDAEVPGTEAFEKVDLSVRST
ncbi:hypothetical protein [Endozoicomonas ascidiicola]|uniref:hypothetical protein n=1 Tax=Endozoicomonas ascidiicola TaxID=1698521 RepID=UPI0008323368|nr:hypothetical protein [Endozoicomonas ascidiicola]